MGDVAALDNALGWWVFACGITRQGPEPNITDMPCRSCGNPLIEVDWNTAYYARYCDTSGCQLFHQVQSTRRKQNIPEPLPNKPWVWPGYNEFKKSRRENYRTLIEHGVPPALANRLKTNRQTQLTLDRLKASP